MWPDWGKFLTLWEISKVFGNNYFERLLNIWQMFKPTLAKIYALGQNFTVVNGKILKK